MINILVYKNYSPPDNNSDELRTRAVNPTENGAEIRTLRQTKVGDVLIEMGKPMPDEKKTAFSKALKDALGESGEVRESSHKSTLMIRDLDIATTTEEVKLAIQSTLGENATVFAISVSKPCDDG